MIRVVLVDDHELFRAGVRNELAGLVDIVGEAGSVAEAAPLVKELDPEVVLLDVHLPDGGGEAVIAAVAPERPAVKFLALSVSDAAEDVIAVIRAGARGYVTKTISRDELADAIRRVAGGRQLDAHEMRLLDVRHRLGERVGERRRRAVAAAVQPAAKLPLLPARDRAHARRIVGVSLHERQRLEHRVVDPRRDVRALGEADALAALRDELPHPGAEHQHEGSRERAGLDERV